LNITVSCTVTHPAFFHAVLGTITSLRVCYTYLMLNLNINRLWP